MLAPFGEGNRVDHIRVPSENDDFLAPGRLPNAHRLVVRGTAGQPFAIPAESYTVDTERVSGEGEQLPAGGGVPNPDRFVRARGGEAVVRGAKGHAHHAPGMLQGKMFLSLFEIPDSHRGDPGQSRIPAYGKSFAVRAVSQAGDPGHLGHESL